ncbi:SPW repeat protein [Rhodococcus sp. D2-41]|uniref:SPW repeat protein n=1 Tax=Speluncibacter jeojiensis TaxID=2710754 RepID=A0A9X4M512_9ACTN|nr:SPW repeat protein [Rhodococcus sp. D2-41]MDG3009409.1 SPW repeat protein [Rhodococcus sp. D2-41]MDG3016964.1 SPW repeat protein [Corynebacteriales bacterium D3-21]
MSTANLPIEKHPDIAALREHYDQAAGTPVGQFTDGLTLLAGLYMAVSPWIIGFHGTTNLMMSNLIAGLAVAVLAIGFSSAHGRFHGLAWTVPALGVWMIISPWVVVGVSTTAGMIWSNVVGGAVVLLLGMGVAGMGMMRMRK